MMADPPLEQGYKYAEMNPWDFPEEAYIVWANHAEPHPRVMGIWLSLKKAKYHAVMLQKGLVQPRGGQKGLEDAEYCVEYLRQRAIEKAET
jgi:hypothetical protein